MKFGGSSVGTARAMSQVADIVASYVSERPVVVVSALQGVTDALLGLARDASRGDGTNIDAPLSRLVLRHEEVLRSVGDGNQAAVLEATRKSFAELGQALKGVAALGELSDRSLDLIVSFGERLSAPIVAAALRARGIAAESVDARNLIETDDRFTSAEVRFSATEEKSRRVLLPVVERGGVPVVTGFIGATADGRTTTIGRGGSDYTAAILGGVLDAKEIWIWKEVDGVMTADPGAVPEARLVSLVTYDEAAEMSFFGAKVLHPKTMIPAIGKSIPIRLRNTFRPEAPGTLIGRHGPAAGPGVKVITSMKKLAMVTVEGKGMMGMAGFAARVFDTAGRLRTNIVMFTQSSSEQNICLVTDAKDGLAFKRALDEELREEVLSRNVESISVEEGVAAVAVVGEGMKGTPGVAGRTFSAVAGAGVNILAIAQGSSERNISFIVRESDADAAVRAVHAAFALQSVPVTAGRP